MPCGPIPNQVSLNAYFLSSCTNKLPKILILYTAIVTTQVANFILMHFYCVIATESLNVAVRFDFQKEHNQFLCKL